MLAMIRHVTLRSMHAAICGQVAKVVKHAASTSEAVAAGPHSADWGARGSPSRRFVQNLAVIALGSNQGDSFINLMDATEQLQRSGVQVLRYSKLYDTAPVGVLDQERFLNAAVLVATDRQPAALLKLCKELEERAGRVRGGVRWGPRPLDLDIIFYGQQTLTTEDLVIPHPRWREREFVWRPCADLIASTDSLYPGPILERGESLPDSKPLSDGSTEAELAEDWWRRCPGVAEAHELALQHAGSGGGVHAAGDVRAVTWLGPGKLRPVAQQAAMVMGILNVTPDSFSDGGQHLHPQEAVEAAVAMVQQGADILDVGGQSTRPGAARLPAQQELDRVMPVLEALTQEAELRDTLLSVDTFHAAVAGEAARAGAGMVNDVSGGTLDAAMLPTVATLPVSYALMHMRGDPTTMQLERNLAYGGGCVASAVGRELQVRSRCALAAGIQPWRMVIDPGIGFAKSHRDNCRLIARLPAVRDAQTQPVLRSCPMLVGVSRKGFLRTLTGHSEPEARDVASASAAVACVAGGADIIRTHNVAMTVDAVRVAEGIFRDFLYRCTA